MMQIRIILMFFGMLLAVTWVPVEATPNNMTAQSTEESALANKIAQSSQEMRLLEQWVKSEDRRTQDKIRKARKAHRENKVRELEFSRKITKNMFGLQLVLIANLRDLEHRQLKQLQQTKAQHTTPGTMSETSPKKAQLICLNILKKRKLIKSHNDAEQNKFMNTYLNKYLQISTQQNKNKKKLELEIQHLFKSTLENQKKMYDRITSSTYKIDKQMVSHGCIK